jgi:HD-GYP domain-containing protein (c-di-GMP phosphodiesterase class II)
LRGVMTNMERLPQGSVDYEGELESIQSQLFVVARDLSSLYQKERKQAHHLEQLVGELKTTYLRVVQTLAFVVEAKDEYTRYHLERCREYGTALAEIIDPTLATPDVQYGFLLHDVGKIGVPESILFKAGPLNAEETRLMRLHPLHGVQIVQPMNFLTDSAIGVIRHHHERFDGEGYPDGLRGENIPLVARIFSVVDAFDAMTTDRPYRRALTIPEALRRLDSGAGTQFDPDVVKSFMGLVERLPNRSQAAAV